MVYFNFSSGINHIIESDDCFITWEHRVIGEAFELNSGEAFHFRDDLRLIYNWIDVGQTKLSAKTSHATEFFIYCSSVLSVADALSDEVWSIETEFLQGMLPRLHAGFPEPLQFIGSDLNWWSSRICRVSDVCNDGQVVVIKENINDVTVHATERLL